MNILQAQTMNVSYDPVEDRVSVLLTDQMISYQMWLTRALLQRLLVGLTNLLLQQKEVDSQHPQAKAAALMMEHVAIAHHRHEQPTPLPSDTPAPTTMGVLTKLDIQYAAEQFNMLFFTGETAIASLSLTKHHLHQVIDLLEKIAKTADWQLDPTRLGWLGQGNSWLEDFPTVGRC